jgi:branched-chain amino acid transport system permease protein
MPPSSPSRVRRHDHDRAARRLASSESATENIVGVVAIALVAMIATGIVGWVFERLFIRPAQGDHLKQILITIGAMIIVEQLLLVFFGANQKTLSLPGRCAARSSSAR